MSFLLDTNICSEHLRRPRGLSHQFMQHSGGLFTSTIVLAELYTWAYRRNDPEKLLSVFENDLLRDVVVLDFDQAASACYGRLHAELLRAGLTTDPVDLMIASVAISNELTLVTHNLKHFQHIPNLRVVDWLR